MKINEIIAMDKLHWGSSIKYFQRDYIEKRLEFFKNLGPYFVYKCPMSSGSPIMSYYLTTQKLDFKNHKQTDSLIGQLKLREPFNDSGYLSVALSALKPEFVGKGLGVALYDCAIIDDNLTIMSDEIQTDDSRKLWMYFSNHPEKYTVAMYDKKTREFEVLGYSQDKKDYDKTSAQKLFGSLETVLLVQKQK